MNIAWLRSWSKPCFFRIPSQEGIRCSSDSHLQPIWDHALQLLSPVTCPLLHHAFLCFWYWLPGIPLLLLILGPAFEWPCNLERSNSFLWHLLSPCTASVAVLWEHLDLYGVANICCVLCWFSHPFPRERRLCVECVMLKEIFFLLEYGRTVDYGKERLKKHFALEIEGGEALWRSVVTEWVSTSVKEE